MSVEVRAKTRSKPNTVHYAAETGDIKQLEHFVREGMAVVSCTLHASGWLAQRQLCHLSCQPATEQR